MHHVTDDRLRLIFTCCHPALTMPARVALTLRLLGGLTTAEIARAFFVPEATMAPPLSPPSGPRSITQSARRIADSSCSTTMTGSRSGEVTGRGAHAATVLDALDADPGTNTIVLISKPPAPSMAERVLERLARCQKRSVVCFLGLDKPGLARTLQQAAEMATGKKLPAEDLDAARVRGKVHFRRKLNPSPARHGEPFPALRAAPLEHEPAILGAHADEKTMRPLPPARIWLERAFTFHGASLDWKRTVNVSERIPGVSIEPRCATVCVLSWTVLAGTSFMSVRSLPKVFHTCGKNCGKRP